MSTIKQSQVVTIQIAGIELQAVQLPGSDYGLFYNQLKEQLAIVPGNSTGKKWLKPLVDKDLNRVKDARVVVSNNSLRSVKVYTSELFAEIVMTYALLGNQKCLAVAQSLITETLERRLDAAFGVKVSEQDRERKAATRAQSIVTRRTLTDRLKDLGFTEGVDYAKLTLQIYDAAGVRNLYQEWKDSGSKIPFRDTVEWIHLYTIEKKEDQLIDLLAHKLMVHEAIKLLGR
jgi:hypothetical protein